MEYRTLGKTGLKVSVVGIGGWPLGGLVGGAVGDPRNPEVAEGWTGAVDEESIRMIHKADELGVNLIDTAEVYGDGHSESIIGLALKGRRDRWVVSTKVRGFYTHEVDQDQTRKRIIEACEGGLRRLRTDYIDLFLLHSCPHKETLPVAMETMALLRRQGKIRASGISYSAVRHVKGVRSLMGYGEVAAMVISYNLLSRNDDGLRLARKENIGTMIASPLASGILSGRWFNDLSTLDRMDWRYSGLISPRGRAALKKLAELRFLTESGERTMAQAALRFIIDIDGVTSVIPGALRDFEIEEDVGAAGVPPLSAKERVRAMEITDQVRSSFFLIALDERRRLASLRS